VAQTWNSTDLPWQDTDLPWKNTSQPWNDTDLPWKQDGASGEESLEPGAVVLTWDGDDTDTRPDFDVDLPSGQGAPLDAETGDVLVIQYRLQSGVDADYAEFLRDTLDAGEVAGDTITVPGVDPLSDGAYYFRARLERDGTLFGAWSNVESVTVAAGGAYTPSFNFSDARNSQYLSLL
jgi:hypothetical protein